MIYFTFIIVNNFIQNNVLQEITLSGKNKKSEPFSTSAISFTFPKEMGYQKNSLQNLNWEF